MNTSRRVWLAVILTIFIVCIGLAVSSLLSARIDRNQRADLLREAKQAALLAPASEIASLSATPADLGLDTYNKIKQRLVAFRSYDTSVRFIYILGYKPELQKQFFYVDSEPVDSKDYSPPGQVFPDTRQIDIDRYLAGVPYTDGPYSDSWGEWVSAYAPIVDTQGTVVALAGVDTATSVWHEQIGFVRTVVALISVFCAIIVAFILFSFYKKENSIVALQKENRSLAHKENKLKELQTMAQIGRVTIYFPDQLFSFDGPVSDMFSVSQGEKIDSATVLSAIHPNDGEKLTALLHEISDTSISYTWTDIRFGSQEKGFRTFHIYGNIERNELLAPIRFSGIIQDVTDIHTS